jgi:hypothetical protein
MKPTADPKVFQITDYQLATSYTCTTNCPFPIEGTFQASGNKALQAQLDTSRNVVTGRVSGESARSYIDGFNWTVKYQSTGTKAVYNKNVGTPASYFQITFHNK